MKPSPLLAAYRLASKSLGLAGPLYLFWRGKLGLEDFSRRRERLGLPSLERPGGPLALLHAANAAQAALLSPLVEKLGQLGFTVVLAAGNGAAGPFHTRRLPPSLNQLTPLDAPRFMARFLDHWRPDIVLVSGADILPNLLVETSRREIPLVLVDGRLSARSFLIWRKFPVLAGSLLGRIDLCLAQTPIDAGRFTKLGIRDVLVTGHLKYDLAPPPVDQSALARLLARIGTRPVWVADGTYPGEEEIVMEAHRRLVPRFPDLLTVIVPHNPRRGFEIAQSAAKMKLAVGLRGGDRDCASLPEIYIAHTRGEAELFYRGAGVIFAGNSLGFSLGRSLGGGGGGKNLVEAASLGCAILHGPDVEDFEEIYKALDQAGGGGRVFDADTLAKQLALLFFDNAELRVMARTAARIAGEFGGASNRIVVALKPYLARALITLSEEEG